MEVIVSEGGYIWFLLSLAFVFRCFGNDPVQDAVWAARDNYETIADVALTLNSSHSGAHFVGVGRSPAAITAVLSELRPNQVTNLPFSLYVTKPGLRPGDKLRERVLTLPLSEADKAAVYQHLDHFLPSATVLGNRDLVLVDYAQTGESVLDSFRIISQYMKDRSRPNQVKFHVLATEEVAKEIKKAGLANLSTYALQSSNEKHVQLIEDFSYEKFDAAAEFESTIPGRKKPEAITRTGGYEKMKTEVKRHMLFDSEPRMKSIFAQRAIDASVVPLRKRLEEGLTLPQLIGEEFRGRLRFVQKGYGNGEIQPHVDAMKAFLREQLAPFLLTKPSFQDSESLLSAAYFLRHPEKESFASLEPLMEVVRKTAPNKDQFLKAFDTVVQGVELETKHRNFGTLTMIPHPETEESLERWRRAYKERFKGLLYEDYRRDNENTERDNVFFRDLLDALPANVALEHMIKIFNQLPESDSRRNEYGEMIDSRLRRSPELVQELEGLGKEGQRILKYFSSKSTPRTGGNACGIAGFLGKFLGISPGFRYTAKTPK